MCQGGGLLALYIEKAKRTEVNVQTSHFPQLSLRRVGLTRSCPIRGRGDQIRAKPAILPGEKGNPTPILTNTGMPFALPSFLPHQRWLNLPVRTYRVPRFSGLLRAPRLRRGLL